MSNYSVEQLVEHDSGTARVLFGPFNAIFGPPRYVIEFVDGPFAGKGIAVGADIIQPFQPSRGGANYDD